MIVAACAHASEQITQADLCVLSSDGASYDGQRIEVSGAAVFDYHYAYLTNARCPQATIEWNSAEVAGRDETFRNLMAAVGQQDFSAEPNHRFDVNVVGLLGWREHGTGPRAILHVERVVSFAPLANDTAEE